MVLIYLTAISVGKSTGGYSFWNKGTKKKPAETVTKQLKFGKSTISTYIEKYFHNIAYYLEVEREKIAR